VTTAIAFVARRDPNREELRWERITSPPCVASYSQADFVMLDAGQAQTGYVNGFRIVGGMHVLSTGDLVRVFGSDGEVSFRYVGRCMAGTEPGRGRRCAFTGLPIDGTAVRCPNPQCKRLLSKAVAHQIGRCMCHTPLKSEDMAEPGEELL